MQSSHLTFSSETISKSGRMEKVEKVDAILASFPEAEKMFIWGPWVAWNTSSNLLWGMTPRAKKKFHHFSAPETCTGPRNASSEKESWRRCPSFPLAYQFLIHVGMDGNVKVTWSNIQLHPDPASTPRGATGQQHNDLEQPRCTLTRHQRTCNRAGVPAKA